jgi:DNA-binding GntR family transcriptional regulator
VSGAWVPGARLQPAEIAERMETSTTVVRDALMQLVAERLCERRPAYGFFVPGLTLRELSDLTRVRIHNDSLALELAIERGDLLWESELLAAQHRLRMTPRRAPEDPLHTNDRWAECHREFHLALVAACDVSLLLDLSRTLFDSSELYRRWAAPSARATVRDIDGEHAGIVEATLARDAAEAVRRLSGHYQETMEVILESGLMTHGQ